MKIKLIITIIVSVLIASCHKDEDNDIQTYSLPGSWEPLQTSSFPMPLLRNPVSFQTEDAYYIGLGNSSVSEEKQDLFFKFTQARGWEILPEFPGENRDDAVAFVLDGKAYVGLGLSYTHGKRNPYLSDFWVYDPVQNSWDSLQMAFPGEARSGAVAFTLEGKAYVGTGYSLAKEFGFDSFGDFYEFSPASGWKQIDQLTVNARTNALSFSLEDETYLGLGTDKRDIMKLSESSLTWTKMHSLKPDICPYLPDRVNSFVLKDKGEERAIVYGTVASDTSWCYTYSPRENIWHRVTDFPCPRYGEYCFVLNNTLYKISGITMYQFVRSE